MAEMQMNWERWVGEQIRKGAGALHAYVKRQVDLPPEFVITSGGRSGSPQDIVESDMSDWECIWTRSPLAAAPWRGSAGDRSAVAPPRPPLHASRKASRSFAQGTAIGVDGIPPRAFDWLSDPLLTMLGDFMVIIEAAGTWPRQTVLAIMRLIPKAAGGRRPIGILASLVRWWERVRQPEIQRWREQHARDYNFSARGRRAEQAVWRQALTDEAAKARGLQSAATLVDLVKAFEMVLLQEVWRAAQRHDFPLWAIALILESCSFVRRLLCSGAVSRGVQAFSGVLAGGAYAADCLFL